MTREEYRLEQAEFYNDKGVKDPKRHFLRGMEHADSTMIYKACEWLKEEYPKAAAYYEHPDSFIDQFKRAMEEE